jgi:hypothetical protein
MVLFKYKIFLLTLLVGFVVCVKSATCISTGNGSWANTGTWSCGSIPTCGDSIVIQAGHTVTISAQQDLRSCGSLFKMAIYGTLKFTTGNKLRLACNSRVYVFSGGSLVPGGGGGNSNELEICGATMWQAGDGTYNGPGCFPSTLTACGAVLPVELAVFEQVFCNQETVCLRWETSSERNNDYYQVERSNTGLDFIEIKRIKSKALNGTTKQHLVYEVTDDINATEELCYYRLKQVDLDKSFKYSDIISVDKRINNTINFSISPNPNTGKFFCTVSGIGSNIAPKIIIKEIGGRLVYEKQLTAQQEVIKEEIDLASILNSGFYFCFLYVGEVELKTKMVISN